MYPFAACHWYCAKPARPRPPKSSHGSKKSPILETSLSYSSGGSLVHDKSRIQPSPMSEKDEPAAMVCVSTYGDGINSKMEAEDTRYVIDELKKSQESLQNHSRYKVSHRFCWTNVHLDGSLPVLTPPSPPPVWFILEIIRNNVATVFQRNCQILTEQSSSDWWESCRERRQFSSPDASKKIHHPGPREICDSPPVGARGSTGKLYAMRFRPRDTDRENLWTLPADIYVRGGVCAPIVRHHPPSPVRFNLFFPPEYYLYATPGM